MTESKMLTTEEVAEILRVDTRTVTRMIKSGALPAIQLGRVYRIRQDQFDEFLYTAGTAAYKAKAKLEG